MEETATRKRFCCCLGEFEKLVDDDWVQALFGSIDQMDADRMASFLTENVRFRFGNAEPVTGRKEIHDVVAGFFSSIKGLKHRLLKVWQFEDATIIQGEVSYTRKEGRLVTVPFMNLFRLEGSLINEYLIYNDVSPLFA